MIKRICDICKKSKPGNELRLLKSEFRNIGIEEACVECTKELSKLLGEAQKHFKEDLQVATGILMFKKQSQ